MFSNKSLLFTLNLIARLSKRCSKTSVSWNKQSLNMPSKFRIHNQQRQSPLLAAAHLHNHLVMVVMVVVVSQLNQKRQLHISALRTVHPVKVADMNPQLSKLYRNHQLQVHQMQAPLLAPLHKSTVIVVNSPRLCKSPKMWRKRFDDILVSD